jgi:hypothetical protein
MQDKVISIFQVQNKASPVITKVQVLGKRLNRGEFDSLPSLYDFTVKSEEDVDSDVLRNTKDILEGLKRGLCTRFPESDDSCYLSVDKKPFPHRYPHVATSLSAS